ncbi:MAG: HlyD family efflux transporter periplasmic adaptor subunit [Ruminococcaceae bacterium]|nr:HlyD family efflux transporter periplasmic adaptor subunit [Oscillospiraceae bacterium]
MRKIDVKALTKKKWFKWAVIAAALLVLFLMTRIGGGSKKIELNYVYHTVERESLVQSINATGTVSPAESYELTSLVSGEVLEAPFEEGQIVEKGDLLYAIDSADVESNLERAERTYQRAQDSYQKILDSAEDYRITAPAAGTVTELAVEVGDRVNAGSQIGTVTDRSVAYLKVPFFSEDAKKIRIGQTATITVSGSFETISGVVESVSELEEVGAGGALVSQVRIKTTSTRGISENTAATVKVGALECNEGANFTFPKDKAITAKASGEIKTIYIKEGNSVSKGSIIAAIDDEDLQDQIKNGKDSLEDSRLSYETAQEQLDNYRITAPISGTVIEKNLKAGDTLDSANKSVNSGAIAIIYDMSHLEFTVSVDELDIKKVEVGQAVEITADSLEGQTFTGLVSKVSINGTTQMGATAYPVTIIIDKGTELLPGMNVSADIIVMERNDVIVVPSEAVSRGNTVLVSTKSATGKTALKDGAEEEANLPGYVRVKVELGANDDSRVEIVSGIEEGDEIAYVTVVPSGDNNTSFGGMGGMGMPSGGMPSGMPSGGRSGSMGGMSGGPMR